MTGSEKQPAEEKDTELPGEKAEADSSVSDKTSKDSPKSDPKETPEENPKKSSDDSIESKAKDDSVESSNDEEQKPEPVPTADVWPENKATDNASTDAKPDSNDATENAAASSITLTRAHVSHLLADVLEDNAEEAVSIKGIRFPMVLDVLLGIGLLVAVGGFTIGLFHMYIIHSASQSISEQHYKKAISLLKGAPLPQIYGRAGSETEELLSKARYLDAIDKIESGTDIKDAITELTEIRPGSKYFALAQEAINENTEAAPVMLQGGAETTESASQIPEPKQTLLEKTLTEVQH